MRKIAYLLAVMIAGIALVIVACQKQDDLSDPKASAPLSVQDTMTICHWDGSDWYVIDIAVDDWPTHEAHGDMFWEPFPRVGLYQWVLNDNGIERHNTMYITELTETTFSGYGEEHEDDSLWDIVDGTINGDGTISYTMDFQDAGKTDLACTGSFECGLGITGTAGGNPWTATYNGGIPEDNELIEINP